MFSRGGGFLCSFLGACPTATAESPSSSSDLLTDAWATGRFFCSFLDLYSVEETVSSQAKFGAGLIFTYRFADRL